MTLALARRIVLDPLHHSEADIRRAAFYLLSTNEPTTMEDYWLARSLVEEDHYSCGTNQERRR